MIENFSLSISILAIFLAFKIFVVEVELIYNIVLISATQQSDSIIHIHKCTLVFNILSHMAYHRY